MPARFQIDDGDYGVCGGRQPERRPAVRNARRIASRRRSSRSAADARSAPILERQPDRGGLFFSATSTSHRGVMRSAPRSRVRPASGWARPALMVHSLHFVGSSSSLRPDGCCRPAAERDAARGQLYFYGLGWRFLSMLIGRPSLIASSAGSRRRHRRTPSRRAHPEPPSLRDARRLKYFNFFEDSLVGWRARGLAHRRRHASTSSADRHLVLHVHDGSTSSTLPTGIGDDARAGLRAVVAYFQISWRPILRGRCSCADRTARHHHGGTVRGFGAAGAASRRCSSPTTSRGWSIPFMDRPRHGRGWT